LTGANYAKYLYKRLKGGWRQHPPEDGGGVPKARAGAGITALRSKSRTWTCASHRIGNAPDEVRYAPERGSVRKLSA